MCNRKRLKWFILLLLLVSTYLGCSRKRHMYYRELSLEEIRPLFKNITGQELPEKRKVKNLRAIFYDYYKLEHLYISFETDQEGYFNILEIFGGKDVKKEEFPKEGTNPMYFETIGFDEGYRFQKQLGVELYDMALLNKIRNDYLASLETETGNYPKDAITGFYLYLINRSKSFSYTILVFKEQGIVYIFAAKLLPKNYYLR